MIEYMKMTEEIKKAGEAVGTISITGKGLGYVRTKEQKNKDESIEIDPAFLNTALQGDTVRVLLHPLKKGYQQTGEVLEVMARSKAGFSGVLELENGTYFLLPSDTRMYTDIIIPEDKLNGAKAGEKVFAVITNWADPKKAPQGEIRKVLGRPGENNAEMLGIALEKGFSSDFPEEVEEEAENLKAETDISKEAKNRRDFRQTLTFTIDPEDAKDFDDALSFLELPNGHYEIGIHIADVSHYVTPGTALDREAARRGTSVYLVDRTIPMLPEALSNDLCSLNPNEDKLTMSAVFDMDKDGKVHKEWFGKTVIHSDKRFSYESAQKVLNDGAGEYFKELDIMNKIAKKLTKERFEEGAVSLDQEEVKFQLDENGVPLRVYKKTRQDTNHLIEEFMLLANRKVAELIAKGNDKVFVYRIHDLPNKEKMSDLVFFLKKLGYDLPNKGGEVTSKSLNELIKSLEGREEKDTIQTAIIRSMAKAIYSTKNIGHYGLAFEYYTHFTSPIRRYPDTVVHRLLQHYLEKKSISKDRWHEYETISMYSSQREKEAAEAERASIKYKQVEYMTYRIGQVYDGVITGVTDFGIFVEEKETKCEGLVRLKDLGDDFYVLNEKEMSIVGRNSKKTYRLGDKVKIKVKDANLNKKMIDYAFVK
jgi:ribonuclease R